MRFRNPVVRALLATILAAASHSGQEAPAYRPKEERLPGPVAAQPVPFSHKLHHAAKLACRDCHAGAYASDQAGLPSVKTCMACHRTIATERPAVQKLRGLNESGKEIEWVRIYRLPDYSFFSHARHTGAKVECETCHGPVARRDALAKEVSTSMTACIACHTKSQAPTDCRSCHELGR